MIYAFRDTVPSTIDDKALPSEAMKYNGVYLENEIEGYKTLNVSGRELLNADVEDEKIDLVDGSHFHGARYEPRKIEVTYQLIASTDKKFRDAYNKMNLLLSQEQVQIIFNDEPDKYFIGTKIGNDEVESGSNSVIGKFTIYCSDPFKYSVTLKEFTAQINEQGELECEVDNKGSRPAVIDYEIVNHQETGYVGIVSDKGVMQFGKIEEADGKDYKENETLATINDLYSCAEEQTGTKPDVMHPKDVVSGTMKRQQYFGKDFLTLDTSKQGAELKAARTFTIPADSSGHSGAKNFYTYFHLVMWAGLMGQTGEMNINWLTSDNKQIAGVCYYKTDTVGNTGKYELWANGKVLRTYSFTTSHLHSQNPWYWNWGHCDLRKEGSKLTYYYWGSYPSYIVPEVENMECAKVQICFKAYKNRTGSKYLTNLGLDTFNYQKLGVDKWKDVPNRYPSGSTLKIDGETSKFYVNDMPKIEDEVVGTQYFKAPVGKTKIRFNVSSWVTNKPTIKVKIREAWL